VTQIADDACYGQFPAFVGNSYEESSLEFSYYTPVEDGWTGFDDEALCILFDVNAAKLTGSSEGSGL
jgi:hypothetical protein